METSSPAWIGWFKRWDVAWAGLTTAWFLYTALVWHGILATGNEWQPGHTAVLSGGIAALSVAPVVMRRAPWLSALLLIAAFIALVSRTLTGD